MRIISFSNASAQALPAGHAQAAAHWLMRFKNSLRRIQPVLTVGQVANKPQQALASDTADASNAPSFDIPSDTEAPPCRAAGKSRPHSCLRVVRELDSAISPDCAGRMVISGRMADVCAELDRMALRAAQTR